MKQLGYYVFAGIYNLHRKFAKMHNKVVLFNGHNHGLNGNLELVSEEITKRDQGCQIVAFSKQDLFHPNGGICSKIKGPVGIPGKRQDHPDRLYHRILRTRLIACFKSRFFSSIIRRTRIANGAVM